MQSLIRKNWWRMEKWAWTTHDETKQKEQP